jgi:hypothetical protein
MTSHTIPPRWVPLEFSFRSGAYVLMILNRIPLGVLVYPAVSRKISLEARSCALSPGSQLARTTSQRRHEPSLRISTKRYAEAANLERPNIEAGLAANYKERNESGC